MRPNRPRDPGHIAERFRAAADHHRACRFEQAARLYQDVLSANPKHFDALNLFGVLRAQQGKLVEGEALLRNAVACQPTSASAHNNFGMLLNLSGRHDEAVREFERATTLNPNDAIAHNNFGIALQALHRLPEALAHFRRAVSLKPDYVEAVSNLGAVMHDLGCDEQSVLVLRNVVARNPQFIEAHVNLGTALQELGRCDEARECFQRVLAADPRNVFAWDHLGTMHMEMGRFDEARRCFLSALQHQPQNVRIIFSLIQCGKVAQGDPHLATLHALAKNPAALSEEQQVFLHFALGKAYADLGQQEPSFEEYCAGNALKRCLISYDEEQELLVFERIRSVFSPEFMRSRAGHVSSSHRPIFILGMMRSGSTLVEQILASHPDVFGAGERREFNAACQSVWRGRESSASYPEIVPQLSIEQLREIGLCYLARMEKIAGIESARITDKMPGNFTVAGLIHLALPGAKVIHTHRNPVDTCLSCFSKLFSQEQRFAYDLRELGRYYREYERLMEHWRAVLPSGVLLEVRYEDLVNDFEGQARRIVAHCGLDWNERCLSFYETERPVRTASQVQVRQPLNPNLARRWRPSAAKLRPLFEGLGIDTEVT